jgi:hypothetical protein
MDYPRFERIEGPQDRLHLAYDPIGPKTRCAGCVFAPRRRPPAGEGVMSVPVPETREDYG